MRIPHTTVSAGFTLIELMIAVTIVGILAAIAIPSYNASVRSSNRTDALNTMQQDAQALQRCYSQNFTYTPAGGCPTPAGPTTTPGGYYSITINPLAATSYTITATPIKAPQTADTQCARFVLLSSGAHSSTNSGGSDTTTTCWGSN